MSTTTRADELEAEIRALRERVATAEHELLLERFGDTVPRFKRGDVVLAPRTLFGKRQMRPARISQVNRRYLSGTDENGDEWEAKTIIYTFFFQRQDGTYSGTSDSDYEHNLEEP